MEVILTQRKSGMNCASFQHKIHLDKKNVTEFLTGKMKKIRKSDRIRKPQFKKSKEMFPLTIKDVQIWHMKDTIHIMQLCSKSSHSSSIAEYVRTRIILTDMTKILHKRNIKEHSAADFYPLFPSCCKPFSQFLFKNSFLSHHSLCNFP